MCSVLTASSHSANFSTIIPMNGALQSPIFLLLLCGFITSFFGFLSKSVAFGKFLPKKLAISKTICIFAQSQILLLTFIRKMNYKKRKDYEKGDLYQK